MSSEKTQNTILIVGDWVVDEYWFLVRHYSDMSAHTGFIHYRLSSTQNDIVTDLCGAGHVARLLYNLRNNAQLKYRLIGMGLWNAEDTDLIAHLIHSRESGIDCPAAKATFRLTHQVCKHQPDIELVTLFSEHPTIRVIRSYHEGDNGLEQINRIDWEPGPQSSPDIDWEWVNSKTPKDVSAIVLYDRQKGAVNADIVGHLRKLYPHANWYVKSKYLVPEWLEKLGNSVKLLVIGPEVAAVQNPWGRWLVNDKLSLPGLEILDKNCSANMVLLSDHREVIVRVNASQECYTGSSKIASTPITQLGWSSAFFAALIFRMLGAELQQEPELQKNDIEFALTTADKHAGVPMAERSVRLPVQLPTPKVVSTKWIEEEKEWDQAIRGHGLIEDERGNLRLDVWRGSSQIPGYVACIKRKKEIIDEIGQRLRAFCLNGSNNKKSLSILLQADPGSGKTYLAKSLSKAFGFFFMSYDITQMVHREEIFDTFDRVATQQANSNNPILVFVDEINGLVEGNPVYGSFLSTLEEGVYLRRGNTYSLKPCVWVFAGTKLEENISRHADKLSDYKSRMTMIRSIDYTSLRGESKDKAEMENQARLEQVYLGASIIRKQFSDVQIVSHEVLERFFMENPADSPARKILKMISSLRNVQYGQVTRKNCEAWENIDWPKVEDKRLVQLIFE